MHYKKNTQDLIEELKNDKLTSSFMQNNKDELTIPVLHEYLNSLLIRKNMSKTALIKNSGLDRHYVYHILSGKKNPSRDRLIILGIALRLDLNLMQDILRFAGFRELYVRDSKDLVIIYCINSCYSVMQTNDILNSLSCEVLY